MLGGADVNLHDGLRGTKVPKQSLKALVRLLRGACPERHETLRCPSLLALEREGEGRERRICGQIEPELFRIRAHHINPQIKVTPLQLPPRRSPGEIACQWEYTLEE